MKKLLLGLTLLLSSLQSWGAIYVEGDLLHPALKVLDRTSEEAYDLRIGYLTKDWDFSLRYMQRNNISYTGGTAGSLNVSVSDADDSYIGARVGYRIGDFTIGGGVGSYNRDFETSFGPTDNEIHGKNVLGLEAFISYKIAIGNFYFKPELNYIAADVPTKKSGRSGPNSYDVKFEKPDFNFLFNIGYNFN